MKIKNTNYPHWGVNWKRKLKNIVFSDFVAIKVNAFNLCATCIYAKEIYDKLLPKCLSRMWRERLFVCVIATALRTYKILHFRTKIFIWQRNTVVISLNNQNIIYKKILKTKLYINWFLNTNLVLLCLIFLLTSEIFLQILRIHILI